MTKYERILRKRSKLSKLLVGTTLAASIFSQLPTFSDASAINSIQIMIDGSYYAYKNAPVIVNNRTYIPIREVSESLGANVWWNDSSKTVGIEKDGLEVAFMIGSTSARVNGEPLKMEPAILSNGVTRVPLRFLSEALGMSVNWTNETRTVSIQSLSTASPQIKSTQLVQDDPKSTIINKEESSTYDSEYQYYAVKAGDSLSLIASKYGVTVAELKAWNQLNSDMIVVGQLLKLESNNSNGELASVTLQTHLVKSGDTIWDLSIKYGVPMNEILTINNLTTASRLTVGQALRIPVHYIPVQATPDSKYGEYLDWWTEAQYLFPIGKVATVTDLKTGKSFQIKRTVGANHADCEPLTTSVTNIAKAIWGGFNWNVRPVLVQVDGRKIAGSMTFMPHDVEYIKENGFDGHFDIHFKNSTRHKDGKIDSKHQEQIKVAAGIQ